MKKFLYKAWAKFLTAFGDIKIFNWPLFMVYDDSSFKVAGDKILEIMTILKPGDIILHGYDNYLDGKFINIFGIDTAKTKIGGDWSHGAIYIGNGQIIHAIAEGATMQSIIDYCQCDRICIFRPKKFQNTAIKTAKQFLKDNVPYDFGFTRGASALYCFELAALCYKKLNIPAFNIKKFLGLINKKNIYVAQSFLDSKDLDVVFCLNPKHQIDYCK